MSKNQQDIELQDHNAGEDEKMVQNEQPIGGNASNLHDQKSLQAADFQDQKDSGKLSCYEKILNCSGDCCGCLRAWMPCFFPCIKYPYIQNDFGNVALVEKFGKLYKVLDAGLHKINPFTDKIKKVNIKTQIIDMQRQVIMTNDNITVNIDALVYYRIYDPLRCQYRLVNDRKAVEQITFAALRAVCGEHSLQEILEEREKISDEFEKFVFDQVKNWGIYIEQGFIKDIVMNQDLQQNLSAVAKAKRLGEAKVISADSDVKSAQLLREAADLLESDAAMQIRYFEALQQMAKEPTPKVMFLPLNDKNFDDKKVKK